MAITSEDRAVFRAAVQVFGPLPEDALVAGERLLRVRRLRAGEHLLVADRDPATDVVFVVRGILREYFLVPDGTERTKAFVVEGQVSGSLADLLSGEPSRANIVAEEPARVLCAAYGELKQLGARHAVWADFGRQMTAALLQHKARREYELLALDAAGRYEAFRERSEGLEARVKAKHVASYVGITPVHLSRLRRARRAARTG